MIKFGGKSQFVFSAKPNRDFLNFPFLHLAIFSLIFNPFLNSLLTQNSFQISSNLAPRKNAHGNQSNILANSLWTGFYGDLRLSIAGTKVNSSTNISTAVASNINSNGNLIINSGASLLATNTDLIAGTVGNTTITGSNISSEAGDINIASKNNTTINASKDTYNNSTTSKAWESNITLGSTAGSGIAATLDNAINALQVSLSLSMNKSKSDTASTTYNNSQLTAKNGGISITSNGTTSSGSQTGGDTTIKGGNILGQDVTITSNGNLSVESLQNSYTEKGKSFGLNFGGGTSNVSGGINYSSNKTDKLWTDNQTSILGTNSVTINTTTNTNIKGAIIANITNTDDLNKGNGVIGYNINSTTLADAIDGGNLTLNTKSLTTQNLNDHHITENFGAGFSTSIGTGMNGNSANPMQNLNFYPTGSTTLSLQNASTKKEGTTFATIGNGTLNITDASDTSTLNRDITKSQIVTLDQITGALDASVTIDNRIFTSAGRNQIANEQKNILPNLGIATGKQLELAQKVWASPNTAIGVSYGLLGYAVGKATGQDVKITFGNNAVQFEGNPLVQRAFTLGNAINYSGIGSAEGGPKDLLGHSYTGQTSEWQNGKIVGPKLGDHEEAHTYQAQKWGPLFLPAYITSGLFGGFPKSVLSMPNSTWNSFEREADGHAIKKEFNK